MLFKPAVLLCPLMSYLSFRWECSVGPPQTVPDVHTYLCGQVVSSLASLGVVEGVVEGGGVAGD